MRVLGDKPLVAHAIRACKNAAVVDHVVLTTDSEEIAQIGRRYGADEIIDRPSRLAADDVPLAPVVEHAFCESEEDAKYILCFQPTAPLVTAESIEKGAMNAFEEESSSVVFARESTHLYWKVKNESFQPVYEDRKNRQDLIPIYEEIGIFISRKNVLRKGSRVGDNPSFYAVSRKEGVDIDTHSDWLLAESYLNRRKLMYRLTGNKETGTGHVYRGITIADQIFKHEVEFIVTQKDDLAINKLEDSKYNYSVLEEKELDEYVDKSKADVFVNDILDTSEDYMKRISEVVPHIVNFEDLGNGAQYADAVVNALYEYSNPPTNHYFGAEYYCLRNEFRYASPHTEISSVDRIMISFGGTDEGNLTGRTLRALSDLQHRVNIDIVLGLGYTNRGGLDSILSEYPSNLSVEVSQNIDSMAEHMEAADLLITSGGRTLYEASSLNLPVISIAQNSREQKHPYAHVSRGILSLGLADYVSQEGILAAVEKYITDEEQRETMRSVLSEVDISNGISRIKSILFNESDQHERVKP